MIRRSPDDPLTSFGHISRNAAFVPASWQPAPLVREAADPYAGTYWQDSGTYIGPIEREFYIDFSDGRETERYSRFPTYGYDAAVAEAKDLIEDPDVRSVWLTATDGGDRIVIKGARKATTASRREARVWAGKPEVGDYAWQNGWSKIDHIRDRSDDADFRPGIDDAWEIGWGGKTYTHPDASLLWLSDSPDAPAPSGSPYSYTEAVTAGVQRSKPRTADAASVPGVVEWGEMTAEQRRDFMRNATPEQRVQMFDAPIPWHSPAPVQQGDWRSQGYEWNPGYSGPGGEARDQFYDDYYSEPAGLDPYDAAAHRVAMPNPVDLGVAVGDIFYSDWGYDQTNIDFYKVTRLMGASVEVVKIGKIRMDDDSENFTQEKVMPDPSRVVGEPMVRRIKASGYAGAAFDVNSFASAFKWDGKPKYQTAAGYGH